MTQDKSVFFDTEFGLNQLSGNRELLIKMLDRFASDYAQFDAEISTIMQQGDMTAGKAKAHTIKGVAGNLGFWNLHAASKTLEDIFKEGEGDMAAASQEFMESLTGTLEAIEEFKSGGASAPVPEAPKQEQSPAGAKEELMGLLESFEFIDADKLAELLSAAGIAEEIRPQIEEAINDLDYPTATELLNS